jgi:hypothetical protein
MIVEIAVRVEMTDWDRMAARMELPRRMAGLPAATSAWSLADEVAGRLADRALDTGVDQASARVVSVVEGDWAGG